MDYRDKRRAEQLRIFSAVGAAISMCAARLPRPEAAVEYRGVVLRVIAAVCLTLLFLASQATVVLALDEEEPSSEPVVQGIARIEIQTVPPVKGVTFKLDGHPFASDEQGVARYELNRRGTFRLEVEPTTDIAADLRVAFSRWEDNVFTPARDVQVTATTHLVAGFMMSSLTNISFTGANGAPVPPSRIGLLELRSSLDRLYTFEKIEPTWLPISTVMKDGNGLHVEVIRYRVDRVLVDGLNVTNRGETQFVIRAGTAPQIPLQLYSIQFSGGDAIFGFPIGSGVWLEHPNGAREQRAFGPDKTVTIDALPLGSYRARIVGAGGLSRAQLIALVPGQPVRLPVISYAVIAGALAVPILALIGMSAVDWRRQARREPQPAFRTRAMAFTQAGLGLLSAAIIITFGLVLTVRGGLWSSSPVAASVSTITQPGPEPPIAAAPMEEAPAPSEADQRAAVDEAFQTVWRGNGGLATFGQPVSPADTWRDPSTGEPIMAQWFEWARLEQHPKMAGTPYRVQLGRLGWEEAEARGLLETEPFAPVSGEAARRSPGCEYFQETGHRLCGLFRAYWHSRGVRLGDEGISFRESLGLFGYPISEEFTDQESGLVVQYFERAVLEYHPENAGTPQEVMPRLLQVVLEREDSVAE